MKVIGLNGRTYAWKMYDKLPPASEAKPHSSYHLVARVLLRSMFPVERVYEEVYLPGAERKLYADFVIPTRKLVVEVHGEQHYHFTSHYHHNILDFIEGKKRDRRKREWVLINKLIFVELPYNESTDEWRKRIQAEISKG